MVAFFLLPSAYAATAVQHDYAAASVWQICGFCSVIFLWMSGTSRLWRVSLNRLLPRFTLRQSMIDVSVEEVARLEILVDFKLISRTRIVAKLSGQEFCKCACT